MTHRILVVDDEPQVRDLIKLYLSKRGYDVATADSSAETLQFVRQHPLDLVVLDINLANEDGLWLLGAIKEAQPLLKVIMLTGMGFVEDLLEEAQQKGAAGYVSKLLPMDELLMTIQQTLNLAPAPAL